MANRSHSWKDILGAEPVNEARVWRYEQLMEAEQRIASALYAQGVTDEVVQAALDAADERLTDDERQEDLVLSSLRHLVSALDGELELRALIGGEAIGIRLAPDRAP